LAVIEPSSEVGRISRSVTIQVAYGAFEPDCRRVEAAHRGKSLVRDAQRNHAWSGWRRAQRHMHTTGVAPQSEQIGLATTQSLGDGRPDLRIHVETLPRRVKSDRRPSCKQRGD
jgi:hypothetical protein